MALGVAVWIGGTIYGGIQINGMRQQAEDVKRQMTDLQTGVEKISAARTEEMNTVVAAVLKKRQGSRHR